MAGVLFHPQPELAGTQVAEHADSETVAQGVKLLSSTQKFKDREICKFKASLVYKAKFQAWIHSEAQSQKKEKENQTPEMEKQDHWLGKDKE